MRATCRRFRIRAERGQDPGSICEVLRSPPRKESLARYAEKTGILFSFCPPSAEDIKGEALASW